MKSSLLLSILSVAAVALASQIPHKSVVFTYPPSTPDRILDAAKQTIIEAGGMITHEYHIFKYVRAVLPGASLLKDIY
jgi:hypothetical protein